MIKDIKKAKKEFIKDLNKAKTTKEIWICFISITEAVFRLSLNEVILKL